MQRKYNLSVTIKENGQMEITAQNTAMSPLEVIGILEMHKAAVLNQLTNGSTTIQIPGNIMPPRKED